MPSILNASVNWVFPSSVLAISAFKNRFPVLEDRVLKKLPPLLFLAEIVLRSPKAFSGLTPLDQTNGGR